MAKYRVLFSALAISLGLIVAEPLSNSAGALAQGTEEAARLNQQAIELQKQGRYGDAEALFKRSLTINEKALGRSHPDLAVWLNILAILALVLAAG